jgi:hypothetical protein
VRLIKVRRPQIQVGGVSEFRVQVQELCGLVLMMIVLLLFLQKQNLSESDWDYVNDDSRSRDTACVRAV